MDGWELEKLQAEKIVRRRLDKAKGLAIDLERELQIPAPWKGMVHRGDLLRSNFHLLKRGMNSVEVDDWETDQRCKIPLDPLLEPSEIVEACFKQARKLKRRHAVLPMLIKKMEDEVNRWTQHLEALAGIDSEEGFLEWCRRAKVLECLPVEEKVVKKALPYREFVTGSKCRIFVGKSDRENDQLTFSIAHGNDVWCHASGFAGSHVVLRAPSGQEVDKESLQDALQLALYHSKARTKGEGEVVYTLCKWVKKAGNKPGKVIISQHKTVKVRIDQKRLALLNQSS